MQLDSLKNIDVRLVFQDKKNKFLVLKYINIYYMYKYIVCINMSLYIIYIFYIYIDILYI